MFNLNFFPFFQQRKAEIEYMKTVNGLEIKKAKKMAEIEVGCPVILEELSYYYWYFFAFWWRRAMVSGKRFEL